MKNYLNNFFKRAKTDSYEDGNSLDGIDFREGFSGIIYFSGDHFIECNITVDEVTIYDSFTDKNHEYMFDSFSEYVQEQMQKNIDFCNDIEETNQYLKYA